MDHQNVQLIKLTFSTFNSISTSLLVSFFVLDFVLFGSRLSAMHRGWERIAEGRNSQGFLNCAAPLSAPYTIPGNSAKNLAAACNLWPAGRLARVLSLGNWASSELFTQLLSLECYWFVSFLRFLHSVSNSAALAPEWRFGNSLWRQKFSQALRKNCFLIIFLANLKNYPGKSWELHFFFLILSWFGKNCHIKMQ